MTILFCLWLILTKHEKNVIVLGYFVLNLCGDPRRITPAIGHSLALPLMLWEPRAPGKAKG